jgi:hypothetical protein
MASWDLWHVQWTLKWRIEERQRSSAHSLHPGPTMFQSSARLINPRHWVQQARRARSSITRREIPDRTFCGTFHDETTLVWKQGVRKDCPAGWKAEQHIYIWSPAHGWEFLAFCAPVGNNAYDEHIPRSVWWQQTSSNGYVMVLQTIVPRSTEDPFEVRKYPRLTGQGSHWN